MRKSWTNATVQFNSIGKSGAPSLNNPILWPSINNQTFFTFGGQEPSWLSAGLSPLPNASCWGFGTDGTGGGSWAIVNPGNGSPFYDLTRPAFARGATVDNTGFIFDGFTRSRTSPRTSERGDTLHIPGIVSFNITSGLWQNDTLPQYIEALGAPQGMLASVSSFGTHGLLIQA